MAKIEKNMQNLRTFSERSAEQTARIGPAKDETHLHKTAI